MFLWWIRWFPVSKMLFRDILTAEKFRNAMVIPMLAAAMISSGEANVVVCGGMENMSRAPFALESARFGYRMNNGTLMDTMINDALWDAFGDYHMGMTAENVAAKFGITREMQDKFAVLSQQKCQKAREAGKFDEEIVPVPIKIKRELVDFNKDEYPRDNITEASLSSLKPAFKNDGTVTVGNASGINDGAAAVILISADKLKELGVKPLAKWVGGSTAGVDPSIMGIGPVESTKKLLKKLEMSIDEIDLIEANEAFAAQCLAVGKLLNWDNDKVNINGGALALGHPVGASGCRILVSLLYEMKRRNLKTGLATLCVGGGMGVSTLVKM